MRQKPMSLKSCESTSSSQYSCSSLVISQPPASATISKYIREVEFIDFLIASLWDDRKIHFYGLDHHDAYDPYIMFPPCKDDPCVGN